MTTNEQVLQTEQQILKKEKQMLFAIIAGFASLLIVGIGAMYLVYASRHVSIEKASISAPEIVLSPSSPGVLQTVFVHEGDAIEENQVVAQVGTEIVKAKVSGMVISTEEHIGKRINPGEPVVTMIQPDALRVVGRVEENKGLDQISVGQQATFTVDAFGGKTFYGTVDSVSPTSEESGIVFNISDKRETKQFDVKVRYNISEHPEFKNGMSAKITITTK